MPRATRRALFVIAGVYASAVALAIVSRESWLLWTLSLSLIGGLQNHLLMLHHEGAHGLLHPRRFWNDFIADFFCGYPFLESLPAYRRFHFAHHRHVTDAARDPEIPFYRAQGYHYAPLSRGRKLWLALLDLSGYHWLQFFVAFLRHSGRSQPRRVEVSFVVFIATLAAILFAGGASLLWWNWLVPQATITFFFAKLRGLREHGARTGELETSAFDYSANFAERFFIFPLNAHLHLTHHRHPATNWFRLPFFRSV